MTARGTRAAARPSQADRAGLVVNIGTSEHIANQNNCFRVMHDLLRKGGIMHNEVPACLFGHGLFNYSPTFFLQLMRQNDYEPVLLRTQFERGGSGPRHSPVPRFVHAMNRKWDRGAKLTVETLPEISITAALRKNYDQDFCTPLDPPRAYMVKRYCGDRDRSSISSHYADVAGWVARRHARSRSSPSRPASRSSPTAARRLPTPCRARRMKNQTTTTFPIE